MAEPYDVAVIGGGVVGCGVLRACANPVAGWLSQQARRR